MPVHRREGGGQDYRPRSALQGLVCLYLEISVYARGLKMGYKASAALMYEQLKLSARSDERYVERDGSCMCSLRLNERYEPDAMSARE